MLLTVCLLTASMSMWSDTRQAVLLLHNGSGTTFEFTQLQDAVNAAESGDTLLLSEGKFTLSKTLTIDKGISIVGAGTATEISGSITVSIPSVVVSQDELGNEVTEKPSLSATMFESVKIRGSVNINKELSGFRMKKCWITSSFLSASPIDDANIDRCVISTFYAESVVSLNIINSHIGINNSDGGTNIKELNYINCTIGSMGSLCANIKATYINCIIGDTKGSIRNSTLINTLYTSTVENKITTEGSNLSYIDHCYVGQFTYTTNEGMVTLSATKEQLLAAGYLGNDGTVVGVEGGLTPFSLVPSTVSVTESHLTVDPDKKQLNVTLKVKAN